MTPIDPLAIAAIVAGILEAVDLRYAIGGSVAASLMGEPRSTLDLDIMIERDVEKTRLLALKLLETCYVDQESAVVAARTHGTFNAIHLDSSMKIDFFVAEDSRLATEALAHRRRVEPAGSSALYFYALEDLVARKLVWFRLGGGVSERQWRDVIGMLRINAGSVDLERLRALALSADVLDLLEAAIVEATEDSMR
jgi:hypothetical protein